MAIIYIIHTVNMPLYFDNGTDALSAYDKIELSPSNPFKSLEESVNKGTSFVQVAHEEI